MDEDCLGPGRGDLRRSQGPPHVPPRSLDPDSLRSLDPEFPDQ